LRPSQQNIGFILKPLTRHVRLKRNFVNRETIPHVGVKLRIPEVLLVEKMRTQQRFNVSVDLLPFNFLLLLLLPMQGKPPHHLRPALTPTIILTPPSPPQVMRESAYGRTHKTVVRKRMDEVLHQLILPAVPPPEGITYFTVQEDESLLSIVDQLRRDCPRWCADKRRLVVKMEALLGE
jgi:hypothetical protein